MNLNFAGAVRQINEMSLLIGESEGDKLVCADLDETAHLFVSGVTGTGKSVFVESMLLSLILRNKPERLKLILFDSAFQILRGVSYADPYCYRPMEILPCHRMGRVRNNEKAPNLCKCWYTIYRAIQRVGGSYNAKNSMYSKNFSCN